MVPAFDIFRIEQERAPMWVEAASSFDEAKDRVRQMSEGRSGEYFIFDQTTGHKVFVINEDGEVE
jgi:hypothetical protein